MTSVAFLIRRLRFQQLDLLCKIADTGSLGGAAGLLRLSRPAVSKGLAELESALETVLFERSTRGMQLTSAGDRIVRHARLLLHELERFGEEVVAASHPEPRPLRLGMPAYLAAIYADRFFGSLRANPLYGKTRIQISDGRISAHVDKLLAGELDGVLALYTPLSVRQHDLDLIAIEHLRTDRLLVVAGRSQREGRHKRVQWADLTDATWILPGDDTHLRRAVHDQFVAAGTSPPRPAIESPSFFASIHMSAAGLGLTVVPESALACLRSPRDIVEVDLEHPLPRTTLTLMHRRGTGLDNGWAQVLRSAFADAPTERASR